MHKITAFVCIALLCFAQLVSSEEQTPLETSRYALCANDCSHLTNRALAGVCSFNCKSRFMKRKADTESKYKNCIKYCAKYSDANSSYSADCRKHCENTYPKDIVL